MLNPTYPIDLLRTILLIVDPQLAFGKAVIVPGAEAALANMRRVAVAWRQAGGTVYITQHTFQTPTEVGRVADFLGQKIYEALRVGSELREFHPGIQMEGDKVIPKTRYNALIGTDLAARIADVDTTIVCGLTTPICVQGTADGLMMTNKQVILLEDACASQSLGATSPEEAHRAAVERMRALVAEITTTDAFIRRIPG